MPDYKSMLEAWGFKRVQVRGEELIADCAICGGRQKFYFNISKGVALCFKGCFTGSAVSLASLMEGCSRDEALVKLWEGVGWHAQFTAKMRSEHETSARRTPFIMPKLRPLNNTEIAYLDRRNVSVALAEEHGAMGCDDFVGMVAAMLDCSPEEAESLIEGFPGRFEYLKNRILWPVGKQRWTNLANIEPWLGESLVTELDGVEARSISGAQPKVCYPRGVNLKESLYYPLSRPKDWIVLVEGIPDQHTVECWNYPCASSFGSGVSQQQAAQLHQFDRVYCAYDADRGGEHGLENVVEKLFDGTTVYNVELPKGKDPNDCSFYEFTLALSNAKRITENHPAAIKARTGKRR